MWGILTTSAEANTSMSGELLEGGCLSKGEGVGQTVLNRQGMEGG